MSDVEIEVIIFNQRDVIVDRGYALSPSGATLAARTMRDDYRKANPYQGVKTKARFYVDGKMVAEVS